MSMSPAHPCPECGVKTFRKDICISCVTKHEIEAGSGRKCAYCGKDIPPLYRKNGAYCSHKCSRDMRKIGIKAINAVSVKIRSGQIPKADTLLCVDCGNQATDYDHRDYSKPLQVDPVCRGCNIRRGPAVFTRPNP